MKALLDRIHARVGDLWWYSAMIFAQVPCGDVINAFIGLWLVPGEKVKVRGQGQQRREIIHCRPRPTFSTFLPHRVLKPHTPDTSWRKDWKSILNYTGPIAA